MYRKYCFFLFTSTFWGEYKEGHISKSGDLAQENTVLALKNLYQSSCIRHKVAPALKETDLSWPAWWIDWCLRFAYGKQKKRRRKRQLPSEWLKKNTNNSSHNENTILWSWNVTAAPPLTLLFNKPPRSTLTAALDDRVSARERWRKIRIGVKKKS